MLIGDRAAGARWPCSATRRRLKRRRPSCWRSSAPRCARPAILQGAAAALERRARGGDQNPELFNDLGVVYAQLGRLPRRAPCFRSCCARPGRGRHVVQPRPAGVDRRGRRTRPTRFATPSAADPIDGEAWQGLGRRARRDRSRPRRSTPGGTPSGCCRATTICCSTSGWCWPTATAPPRRCRISSASCAEAPREPIRARHRRASRRRSRRHAGEEAAGRLRHRWPFSPRMASPPVLMRGRGADVPTTAIAGGALRGANVLLVTIDTLRADHVGAYGGRRADADDRSARRRRVALRAHLRARRR